MCSNIRLIWRRPARPKSLPKRPILRRRLLFNGPLGQFSTTITSRSMRLIAAMSIDRRVRSRSPDNHSFDSSAGIFPQITRLLALLGVFRVVRLGHLGLLFLKEERNRRAELRNI